MSLTDMIVKPHDGEYLRFTVKRGSRSFSIIRGPRDDSWLTYDRDSLLATEPERMFLDAPCLDVSGDLAGSLEFIDGLFR